jgi:ABC-type Mn2+/Zn2+ transport system ATPase subunit
MGRGVVVEDLNDLYAKIDEARSLKMEPYVKDTGLLDYIDRRLTELSEGRRKR